MHYTFAHFSDVHLAPTPWPEVFHDFAPKRMLGGLSWHLRRKTLHLAEVSSALLEDIRRTHVDHIAFTGDLVNLSTAGEFARASRWLSAAATLRGLSFVPGNHDAYVTVPAATGLDLFAQVNGAAFPFVHLKRNVAFIGLNSACPQSLVSAGGTLGPQQLNFLAAQLTDLKSRGFYRVVMIHHPPLPGLATPRKALTDAAELRQVLADQGAEVVLHGHNHKRMLNWLDSAQGAIPIVGVASASSCGTGHHEPAEWNRFTVQRVKGAWLTEMERHAYVPASKQFRREDAFVLLR